jgi:hypothetical protein
MLAVMVLNGRLGLDFGPEKGWFGFWTGEGMVWILDWRRDGLGFGPEKGWFGFWTGEGIFSVHPILIYY